MKKNKFNELLHEDANVLTHNDLEINSNKFANYLLKRGIKKNDRIIIMLDLHIETIITVFGVIKTGAIYVPVDKNQTSEWIEKISSEIQPKLVITNDKNIDKFEKIKCKKIIISDKFFENLIENDILPNINIIDKDLIYIAFTSGTTGTPKGVMIPHRAVMTFVEAVTQNHRVHNELARTLCRTPISFDPFLTEILPSIVSGGQVFIQERDVSFRSFLKLIQKNKITNFGCGPSQLFLMADNLEYISKFDLSSLKEIYIGYEKCPVSGIRKLQESYPYIKFINGYGTTETFASSTFFEIPKLESETYIPIGKAIENEQLFILNEKNEKCKKNEIGELIIRGSSLFSGYWKDQEETNKKLITNPLFPESNELVYRTGDLVEEDEEGNIFFVGRKDEQVKINGYRVELGEIQEIVEKCEEIKECCVIYYNNELVCFYNVYNKNCGIEIVLKEQCKKQLAKFKVPNKWIKVNEFPRTSNGKIDRKKMISYYGKVFGGKNE